MSTLFSPFLDVSDMVLCTSADATLAEIQAQAAAHGLRFPLEIDSQATLRAHLVAAEYAPASARFGPYVDNVVGMNWELPAGRVVRVGERVIKSTTGYDLTRFLLHSDGRYGRPREVVLRLRPRGGAAVHAMLRGPAEALARARAALLVSPWIHWIDAVDALVSAEDGIVLELAVDAVPGEEAAYEEFFLRLARECGAVLTLAAQRTLAPRLPGLAMKTTITEAVGAATELVGAQGGTARVLVANGVVHYHPPSGRSGLREDALAAWRRRCAAAGGHLSGPWAGSPPPSAQEAIWARELENAWRAL